MPAGNAASANARPAAVRPSGSPLPRRDAPAQKPGAPACTMP